MVIEIQQFTGAQDITGSLPWWMAVASCAARIFGDAGGAQDTELQIVEGSQHRDFADIVWQITERGTCNEFVVRYDCGHSLRAEICVPAIPSTKDGPHGGADAQSRSTP
eukprot:s2673_g1.t1